MRLPCWFYDYYNYGCACINPNFPKTLRPSNERRTWRLLEDESIIYSNILFIDLENNLTEKIKAIYLKESEGFYLIKNNQLPTMDLFKKAEINVRNYKLSNQVN